MMKIFIFGTEQIEENIKDMNEQLKIAADEERDEEYDEEGDDE